jgi:RsiW-degrading membrane proteinase PrsW (M82 family)
MTLNIWEPLQGRTPLWKVVWVYGFGVSLAYAGVGLALPLENTAVSWTYTLIGLLIGLYQLIGLWRCAFNSRSRAWGVLIRISVVASLLLIPVCIYLFATQPALFDL